MHFEMADESTSTIIKFPHHIRSELCTTRPPYRQGRKLTAVKVYTVNEESQHLLIRGVPVLNLQKELKHLCMRYGGIKFINLVRNYSNDEEPFTEVYHVSFLRIQAARFAKHMIDDKSFYGGILHVCYAPELESVTETKQKLQQRKYDVLKRVKSAAKSSSMLSTTKTRSEDDYIGKSSLEKNESSFSGLKAHQTGIVAQTFVPRKRPYASGSHSSSISVSRSKISEEKHLAKKAPNKDSVLSPRISIPDKFLPSPLKRIKFNKNRNDS